MKHTLHAPHAFNESKDEFDDDRDFIMRTESNRIQFPWFRINFDFGSF
jgi:hypothetical protein